MVDISGKNPDLSHVPAEGSTWVQTLQQMEGTVSNQPVSTALRGVNSVFSSAINEYRNAATAYILAAQLPKAKQASGVTVAKSERLQGDSLWATAVDLLNSQRSAAGLSRLTLPNPGVAPAPPPSTKSPSPKKSSGG
jgi:hypothetical protein